MSGKIAALLLSSLTAAVPVGVQDTGTLPCADCSTSFQASWAHGPVTTGQGHAAGVAVQSRSLSYVCRPGGLGMLVVTGLGGGGRALAFAVDGQIIEASFQTQDGVHFTEVKPDSAVLEGLMDGRQVQVVAGQITAVFPLAGSDTAIRRAMKECSLQP